MKKIFLAIVYIILGLLVLLGIGISTGSDDLAIGVFIIGCLFVVYVLPALVVIGVIAVIVKGLAGLCRKQPRSDGERGWREGTLEGFLLKAKDRGLSDEKVSRLARANGWSDAEIQEARRGLSVEGV